MREQHQIEVSFERWKQAGYGTSEISEMQLKEIKRAFYGGVFEGLNFLIAQLDKNPLEVDQECKKLYSFLKAFHENEVLMHKKSPFGKNYF